MVLQRPAEPKGRYALACAGEIGPQRVGWDAAHGARVDAADLSTGDEHGDGRSAHAEHLSDLGAAAKGMGTILEELDAVAARRRRRNVVVTDPDSGDALVSLRLYLLLESPSGRAMAAHLYFSDRALAPAELRVMETAVALAVRQEAPSFSPAVALVRMGALAMVNAEAMSAERVEVLRAVSSEYQDAWDAEG